MNQFVRVRDAHIAVLIVYGWKTFYGAQKGADLSDALRLHAAGAGSVTELSLNIVGQPVNSTPVSLG